MSREIENVEVMRRVYERWHESKGEDVNSWFDAMDERVSFRSIGSGAAGLEFTSERKSRSEVRDYLEELVRDWQMIFYIVDEFIAQGDRVVMLGRCSWRFRATDKVFESPKADFTRLRDGKIVEFTEFFDTAKAIAATN